MQLSASGGAAKGMREAQKAKRVAGPLTGVALTSTGARRPLGGAVRCWHLGAVRELSQCLKTIWSPFKISPGIARLGELRQPFFSVA